MAHLSALEFLEPRLLLSSTPSVVAEPEVTALATSSAEWASPLGIPTPVFGISQSHYMYEGKLYDYGSGLQPYRDAGNGPYTHYVDKTHANATDSSNPFGTPDKPRLTIPKNLSAGSVVEVHGNGYNYDSSVYATGTADKPVFIRGVGMPRMDSRLRTGHYQSCSYMIVEGMSLGGFSVNSKSDHIVLRNSEVRGTLTSGGITIASYDTDHVTNVLIYNNNIHHNGDYMATFDQDVHGVTVNQNANNVWILDNEMSYNSGNGVQINAGSLSKQANTHHIYVGRNTVHHNKQAGLWTKQAVDVIFSQNVCYSAGQPGDWGEAGLGFQYGPERVWFLMNHIYDCGLGIAGGSTSGMGFGENIYVIGNLIHDIRYEGTSFNSSGWGNAAIMLNGGVNRYIYGNTIYNAVSGINSPGGGNFYMGNNIISNITNSAGKHINFDNNVGGDILNSVLWQNGQPVRIRWGSSSVYTLEGLISAKGKGSTSMTADPKFVSTSSKDFHLASGSPAINKALTPEYVATFMNGTGLSGFSGYGLNIAYDLDGNARSGAWDIGAYETGGTAPAPVNQAPVAVNDTYSVNAGVAAQLAVLANDYDADGDGLTITGATSPSKGTAVINANGTITYTAAAGSTGADTFSYTLSDGRGGTASATVALTIVSGNAAPTANTDSFTTLQDTSLVVSVANLLANDTDPNGDTLTVTSVASTQQTNGTVSLSGGNVTYTPAAAFSGAASFVYTISDGNGGSAQGIVNVTVQAVAENQAPITVSDHFYGNQDQQMTIPVASILANDSDPDGDPLTVTSVYSGIATHGTIELSGQNIIYTPNVGRTGWVSFYYTISDGNGGEANGTISIRLDAVAALVEAVDDVISPSSLGVLTIDAATLTANDTGGDLAITGVRTTADSKGTVELVDGDVVFTPAAGFNGVGEFEYCIGSGGNASWAKVTIMGTMRVVSSGSPVSWTDSTGTLVTVTLSGDGTGQILLPEGGTGDAIAIEMYGTTSRSTLTFSASGDGTSVQDIVINGSLKKLWGTTTDLTGSLIATGEIKLIRLRNVTDAQIELNTGLTPTYTTLSATFDQVSDTSFTVHEQPVNTLSATEWLDTDDVADTISGVSIKNIRINGRNASHGVEAIAGNLQADLDLSSNALALGKVFAAGELAGSWMLGGSVKSVNAKSVSQGFGANTTGNIGKLNVLGELGGQWSANTIGAVKAGEMRNAELALSQDWAVKGNALGSLKVGGSIEDSRVCAKGNIGAIVAGRALRSDFHAGVAEGVTGLVDPSDFLEGASSRINKLQVNGLAAYDYAATDLNVAAPNLGTVSIGNLDDQGSGQFGVVADVIGKASWQNGTQRMTLPSVGLTGPGTYTQQSFVVRLI